jgi:hypothetical protein
MSLLVVGSHSSMQVVSRIDGWLQALFHTLTMP